ncbi:hypothetical protein [Actinophytocola sp. KF-1]
MDIPNAAVAVAAPGRGPQRWAGAPSAALDDDGSIVLAYRVRGDRDRNVLARSADGEHFETVATFETDGMVERPALVRTPAGWRMYTSCSTPGTKHWWIGLLEASTVEGLASARHRPVLGGDERTGVKDPVVRFDGNRWHVWICCHPLDVPGAEDRMSTAYTTSVDGVTWSPPRTVLSGRAGRWDARGARLTGFLPNGMVSYDGRATAAENWFERTGFADATTFTPLDGEPLDLRYLEVLALADGSHRAYWEGRIGDGTHELRTAPWPNVVSCVDDVVRSPA